MKKLFYSIAFLSLLAFLLSGTSIIGSAQDLIPTFEQDNTVRFSDLGFEDTQLFAPFDAMQVQFSLPSEYDLAPGSQINLDVSIFLTGSDITLIEGTNSWLGRLDVFFNNELVYQVELLEAGEQNITIQLSGDALIPQTLSGRHTLEIQFSSDINCIYDVLTSVNVQSSSSFFLPYNVVAPTLDLTRFPAPLYQPDSILQSHALIVVPNSPSLEELESAMLVATNLGSVSNGSMGVELKEASQVSPDEDASKQLILVGLPASSYGSFTDEPFLLNWQSGGYSLENEDDGVIQIAYSPLNPAKTIIHVSGNTVAGLRKAAQAFNAVPFYVTEDFRYVKIKDVLPTAVATEAAVDLTFAQLGYVEESIQQVGISYIDVEFNVSAQQIDTQSAYLDLRLNYSKLIDPDVSLMTVFLNGIPIGSIDFKPENADFQAYRITIPPGLLRTGENLLEIVADLVPLYSCASPDVASVWMNISDLSALHIPLATASDTAMTSSSLGINFRAFPNLFVTDENLSELAVIFPADKPAAWNAAARVMYRLGNEVALNVADFHAAFGDDVSDDIKQNSALMIFGEALDLPIIQELGDALPAPFAEGSNVPTEKGMKVVYSIPEGVDLGYLELFDSPWSGKPAMAVLGSSDTGIILAGNALVIPTLTQSLAGDFAVSNGTQVLSANSRLSAGVESAINQVEPSVDVEQDTGDGDADTGTGVVTQTGEPIATPPWMMTVLAISSGVIILILAAVLIANIVRGRKSRYLHEDHE